MRPIEEQPWPQFIINGFLMLFWVFIVLAVITVVYELGKYIKRRWG